MRVSHLVSDHTGVLLAHLLQPDMSRMFGTDPHLRALYREPEVPTQFWRAPGGNQSSRCSAIHAA